MWFGLVLGQQLWQLSRLAWKHKNVNATYMLFMPFWFLPLYIPSREVVLTFLSFQASLLSCHICWPKTSPNLNIGPAYTVHVWFNIELSSQKSVCWWNPDSFINFGVQGLELHMLFWAWIWFFHGYWVQWSLLYVLLEIYHENW